MQQTDDRSLKELLGDLTQNVTTLFRKEIELARARGDRSGRHARRVIFSEVSARAIRTRPFLPT